MRRRILILGLLIALAAIGVHAQTITTVTGTIIDPQGIPYANGSVSVVLNVAGGSTLTVTATGAPAYNPPPVSMNSSGFFTMNIIASASYSTSTPYIFTFCAPSTAMISGNVAGASGICFTSTSITIAGASQDLSATVNPSALSLAKTWNPSRIFNTAPAAGTASIGATTMFTTPAQPAGGTRLVFSFYVTQTALGASCAGNSTIVVNLIMQDPNAAAPQTIAAGTFTVTTNGTLGQVPMTVTTYGGNAPFIAKAGTVVQYSTTYTPGGSCSPAPAVQLFPTLEYQ